MAFEVTSVSVNVLCEGKLAERLDQIRSQPKLQSQQQTSVVLSAVEDTLRDQQSQFTPTAYFAALISLLTQYVSSTAGIVNKDVASAVVYLLDLVTPAVPAPLLQTKFVTILESLSPAMSHPEADAPFLRSAIGCLVSLLSAQDAASWALPQTQTGPRQAMNGLLGLSLDHRPKVRKRAQEGLATVLQNSHHHDHPAAEMCAETALRAFEQLASALENSKKPEDTNEPALIHAMQLIKVIATACGGWPVKSLESLCGVLFGVARSKSNFLTMTAFDVFESILAEMTGSDKVPRLLDSIADLQPSPNDAQLLPPWLAIVSRGFDVYAQTESQEAFQKLPNIFSSVSEFLASPSYNIRVSASECLVSFCVNCIPASALLEPSVYDDKVLESLASIVTSLFSVKYQSAWMEVFDVLDALFGAVKWQSSSILSKALAIVGELRSSDSFPNKAKADAVIGTAIASMGPKDVLSVLPLNFGKSSPGRAWLLPLLRDNVCNTNLSHFKTELVPLSAQLFEKIMAAGDQKTVETKIFETLVHQIWSCLPGYCDRPLDLKESFDQGFAETLSAVLYQQPAMRLVICRSMQTLVEGFKVISAENDGKKLMLQGRISKSTAEDNLDHLSQFSPNILAVLFNVYGETVTQQRGPILNCIDAYLGITSEEELASTFERVVGLLDSTLKQAASEQPGLPPTSHALMDIVVVMAKHLPHQSCSLLFTIATSFITNPREPQLQKKAYKLIPRLSNSPRGQQILTERSVELRQAIIDNAHNTATQAQRDRLNTIAELVKYLPRDDLSFIPAILPEIILGTKETNERARESAYNLLVRIGEILHAGGTVVHEGGASTSASIDEYFTMLSAGLAGTSPHMISATVTALSRCLFQFREHIAEQNVVELLQTMDLFLKSPTREVVRSVLGFVKICVIILPAKLMEPRLHSLVPSLMSWSHEHKAHFRAKVKHILERMIRRYGVEALERHCPAEDKRLITNIRKTRERRKRKQPTEGDDGEPGQETASERHDNEFDNAIYGSSDESDEPGESGEPETDRASNGKSRRQQQTFIHEEEDEPLDLLDKKSLLHMSSSRPQKQQRVTQSRKIKFDADGKLILGENDNERPGTLGLDNENPEGGIDAYVAAIRGRDAPKRGQRGRLKFTNKRGTDDEDEEQSVSAKAPKHAGRQRVSKAGRGRGKPRGFSQR